MREKNSLIESETDYREIEDREREKKLQKLESGGSRNKSFLQQIVVIKTNAFVTT
jgi:hypothetical protein